jgi:hypothetical protein
VAIFEDGQGEVFGHLRKNKDFWWPSSGTWPSSKVAKIAEGGQLFSLGHLRRSRGVQRELETEGSMIMPKLADEPVPAIAVLQGAIDAGVQDVVVVGREPDGALYLAASEPNADAVVGKLFCAAQWLATDCDSADQGVA